MDLFRLRQKRLRTKEFLAVDSTSRSFYGNSIAFIRWGKRKEHDLVQWRRGPSIEQIAPDRDLVPLTSQTDDDFNSLSLGLQWLEIRSEGLHLMGVGSNHSIITSVSGSGQWDWMIMG